MAGTRILLAEDSKLLGELVQESLGSASGHEVVVCEDGFKCVSVFARLARARNLPALVILDIQMPAITGMSVARAMRAMERGLGLEPTAILFFTVQGADDQLRGWLSELGRAVHLQKGSDTQVEEQARRLSVAVERLLKQLGGGR